MQKKAISIAQLKSMAPLLKRVGIGAAAGGLAGYHVTGRISGYQDVPAARRVSAYSDAVIGALAGALTHRFGGIKPALTAFKHAPWQLQTGLAGIPAIGELPPIVVANQTKQREAAEMMAGAAKQVGGAAQSVSIPGAVGKTLTSGPGKGALMGAAGAGLASIVTALARRKTEDEIRQRKTRGQMIGSDFLKYLLPAMLAGGVVGSLRKQ